MKLVGMLDSPYVRRVAVSLQLLGLKFEHQPISLFSTFEQFRKINPVVKAPSLVCDDGTVLMDSSLILDYAELLASPGKSLRGSTGAERVYILRLTGLALVACEKSVQIVYEHQLRPAEKLHTPWLSRITGQLLAAYEALESECARTALATDRQNIHQGGICVAAAWRFTQAMLPEVVDESAFPLLSQFSATAEKMSEFANAPHGSGTYRPT